MINPVTKTIRILAQRLLPKEKTDSLLSVAEAAYIIGLDVKTIYYHIKQEHLKTIKWHGLILVTAESVNAFLERGLNERD